jgi:tRNA modification GTPase
LEVLVGPPNVGKSRLYNALLGQDRAIVSPQAGTTRDYLSALCDCNGLVVELVDTAGIEDAGDTITAQAQARRAQETERADLLLACRSAETGDLAGERLVPNQGRLNIWTKGDQAAPDLGGLRALDLHITSAASGMGLNELRSAIAQSIRGSLSENDSPAGTGARCRGSLHNAEAALRRASETIISEGGEELVAFDLRLAVDELGRVVGAVVTDDILDRIFRRFCIGK